MQSLPDKEKKNNILLLKYKKNKTILQQQTPMTKFHVAQLELLCKP